MLELLVGGVQNNFQQIGVAAIASAVFWRTTSRAANNVTQPRRLWTA